MKFNLSTCGYSYEEKAAKELSAIGFTFVYRKECFNGEYYEKLENPTIEIDTIEELMSLLNSLTYLKDMAFEEQRLIISNDEILIYDGYVE